MLADHRDGLSSSSFLAWSSIAQSVCQQAFSLLVNRYLRPWVRILPSAEEDNLSPLDSNIACLCQSIEINNNKHICMYVMPSAEEDNLSPFDSKIACLCQSIEINNNKYVYRQSQVRMPHGSGVRWAECLLILGTGCRVQVLAWSLIAQSVFSRHSVYWRIGTWDPLGSNPAFSRGRQLVSFRFEYRLPVPEYRN